jgi:plastocyanin
MRWSISLPLAVLLAVPFAALATAADVDVDLIAAGLEFHVGNPSAPSDPTITAIVGDVIRFRVENQDATLHTFTVPHFGVNENLATAGPVVFVNITVTSADAGRWQFWCDPHSSGGTPETHTGMIGFIQVNSATQPRTPGFEASVTILAAVVAFTILAVRWNRKRS